MGIRYRVGEKIEVPNRNVLMLEPGGGDAELRDGGQRVDKEDVDHWCTTPESHDRTSCVCYVPNAWNKGGVSPKLCTSDAAR